MVTIPGPFNDSIVPGGLSITFRDPIMKIAYSHAIAREITRLHGPHSRGIRYGEFIRNVMWIPSDEQQRAIPYFEGFCPPSIHETFSTK